MHLALSWWPWLAVVVVVTMTGWPLVATPDTLFADSLRADNVVTPWFYDLVARQIPSGFRIERLSSLNFPLPLPTRAEFPSAWDAHLFAPLAWLFGWPRQWGAVQLASLWINGVGTALLARAMGARGMGIAVAGALAVWSRPVWRDLATGRMNGAIPGLTLAALGLWLLAIERGSSARWAAVGATVAGVFASLTYPPYVALGIPVGVVLGAAALRDADWSGRLRATGIVCMVALLSWSGLQEIVDAAPLQQVESCTRLGCPAIGNAVSILDLFRHADDVERGLGTPGALASSWLLASTALLMTSWKRALPIALLAGFYAVLSLGSCPMWDAEREFHLSSLPASLGSGLQWLSCRLQPVHDYNRLLSMSALLAAALAGIGVDRIARSSRLGWLAAMVGSALVLQMVCGLLMGEVLLPAQWHKVTEQTTASHQERLSAAQQGPMLELPFDRSGQFLSVLQYPEQPRANPLREVDPPPFSNRFWRWAFALGHSRLPSDRPSLAETRASGLRWIYLDVSRCGADPNGVCRYSLLQELLAAFGRPTFEEGTTWAWDVHRVTASEALPPP